jgi:exodeoxyribonuclease V gamma subunit
MIEIYRSSRIETLADLLAVQLHRRAPPSVLLPQQVVVGQLGMKRWLTQHLAQMRLPGVPRIAANLQMLLPSEWLDQLAQAVLGLDSIAIAPYRRTALRWRIYQLLPTLDAVEVQRYLGGEDAPRRRFQLADRLAGLYVQYSVYRRDWLLTWERSGGEHWQAQLWQRVVSSIGQPHRGQRLQDLARRLHSMQLSGPQSVLHVFGISHLPPDALAALEALSTTRTVCIYFPDPCRELWEDLRARRSVYQEQLEGGAFLGIGHPLLAALGRMGQHFSLMLNGLTAQCDLRDSYDDSADGLLPPAAGLLARVQHSVRTLRPDWLAADPSDHGDPRLDASLRVHICHTRLRELEVLKDALLDALARDPQLHPRQIVVMAPNMALYAALLPVVFGEPGDARALLAYQLADVALVRTHPLLSAVRELLDLPSQRITRSQVLALLALPAVARRLGLNDRSHAALDRWLQRCNVAWGLDGAMKEDFGAAAVDAHSFAFAVDRMMAGYLLGQVAPDTLLDGILPAAPVSGPDVECLGALYGLLQVLHEWRRVANEMHPLAYWAQQLRVWFERLFSVDPLDERARDAFDAVLKLTAGLAEQARDAGMDTEVNWAVVREVLVQGLDGIPERQAFLAGGVTFCGMVPQRAIPFEVVAMIGLNDGEYPRARSDSGLDLMQHSPRLGDRDNRSDDRYLFLEALMSARQMLHLSYLGEGAHDGKPRNPALPLAELIGFLAQLPKRSTRSSHSAEDAATPDWCVRHPLQPFDARYFNSNAADPRLYSYSTAFAGFTADPDAEPWRFMAAAESLGAEHSNARVELANVMRFYADPARWVCQQALKLSRRALQDVATDDMEPLDSAVLPYDPLCSELVWDALHAGHAELPGIADPPPSVLHSGAYASGELGLRSWAILRTQAQGWLSVLHALPPFGMQPTTAIGIPIDLDIDGMRLLGNVGPVYVCGEELWLVRISSSPLSFKQLLPLFVQWAALRLSLPERTCQVRVLQSRDTALPTTLPYAFVEDPALLHSGLAELLRHFCRAGQTAQIYHPRSSYMFAISDREKDEDQALKAARQSWLGSDFNGAVGERDYAPHYNRLLSDDDAFLTSGTAEFGRFATMARELLRSIFGPVSAKGGT